MQTLMIKDEIVEFQVVARDITAAKKSRKEFVKTKAQRLEARRLAEEFE